MLRGLDERGHSWRCSASSASIESVAASGAAGSRETNVTERDDLSMQNDNTAFGREYGDTVEAGPISEVVIGDRVVDSTGKELGKVKFSKMGDPTAASDKGQWDYHASLLGWGSDYDLSGLPEQAQEQFMRVGYIHIDISMARDRFAGAGQIDRVVDNTVYLKVPEENLPQT